jgi:AraC-like DNA-binding protein
MDQGISGATYPARHSWPAVRAQDLAALPMADAALSRVVAHHVRAAGLNLQSVLAQVGITSRQIDNPDERLPAGRQIAFINRAAAALKDDVLGFRLAQSIDCRQLGLLYYVFASSATLGDAIGRCARYSRVANEAVVLRVVENSPLTIRLEYAGVARHTDVQQMEFIIAILLRMCRHATGRQLMPERISMVHVRATIPPELSKFFGDRIEFGRGFDEVVLPSGAADLGLVNADPYLNKIILANCEAFLAQRLTNVGPFRIRVENTIASLLPHASARAATVAQALGMSERTMERKLAREGSSFNEILQQLKLEMAIRYVEDRALPISRIAWLLGFEQVSSFNHAFKRWTGKSPRRMRYADPAHA